MNISKLQIKFINIVKIMNPKGYIAFLILISFACCFKITIFDYDVNQSK